MFFLYALFNTEKLVFVFCGGNLSGTVNTIVKCLAFYCVGLLNTHFYITMSIPILYEERRLPDIVGSYEKTGIKWNLVSFIRVTRRQNDESR
jgi:hypothetical protein